MLSCKKPGPFSLGTIEEHNCKSATPVLSGRRLASAAASRPRDFSTTAWRACFTWKVSLCLFQIILNGELFRPFPSRIANRWSSGNLGPILSLSALELLRIPSPVLATTGASLTQYGASFLGLYTRTFQLLHSILQSALVSSFSWKLLSVLSFVFPCPLQFSFAPLG